MNIVCARDQGGCGHKFQVTGELLEKYRQCAEKNESSGCPNGLCTRVLGPDKLKKLVHLVDLKFEKWPGFPLKKPVVPTGRRKNGAVPGVSFKEIAKDRPDRPPTPEEILRVRRYFAGGLDDGTDCPCCTRHARRQHRALGCGPARWLIELIYLSEDGEARSTGEILKSLKGNNVSGSDATSILPLYGLIVAAPDPKTVENPPPPGSKNIPKGRTSGFWKSTKLGRAFALDKIKVPERIVTCLGVPEAFEGDPVSIKDALGKKFNYDEIMGRNLK